jgi:hypothetical protein
VCDLVHLKWVVSQQFRQLNKEDAHGLLSAFCVCVAAVLAAGTKATFVPDLASQHIEQAKTVLMSGPLLMR